MTALSELRPVGPADWSDRALLLRQVTRFNLCLATPLSALRWAHELALAEPGLAGLPDVWQRRSLRPALSAVLAHPLQTDACFDPDRPEWPLVLLSDTDRITVCQMLAAALMHRSVRRTLSREEVLRWRDWLTPPAWRFAMEGAALLPAIPPEPVVDPTQITAETLGMAWLWLASAHWDPGIAERWRLRHGTAELPQGMAVSAEMAHRTALTVLFAVQPQWHSRFAR